MNINILLEQEDKLPKGVTIDWKLTGNVWIFRYKESVICVYYTKPTSNSLALFTSYTREQIGVYDNTLVGLLNFMIEDIIKTP